MQRSDDGNGLGQAGNLLLRRLAAHDRALLMPHLEAVSLPRGAPLIETGEPMEFLYFPESVIVSLAVRIGSGLVEVGVVGREGLVGWPSLLGSDSTMHVATVQHRAGKADRISVASLREASSRSASLCYLLLQFVHIMVVQMTRAIVSHLHDPLDKRLARWLLMRHDRLGGDVLLARHEEIAENLNVRRASITDRLHVLEGYRLVRCTRGKIVVRDRPALEVFASDAYGAAEAHYRALIAPFGKSHYPALAA